MAHRRSIAFPFTAVLAAALVVLACVSPAPAAPESTMTIGVHVTLVSRWLDPAETEGLITPFMVLYALHDALVKPMPAGLNTPSQTVGIKTRVRTMERAAFLSSWREKKLKGLLIGATGAGGNAAARLEPFVTRTGIYAYGVLPELEDLFFRQAKELDRKQREVMLHQMQRSVAEHTLVAPLFQQAFIWGVGKRVAEPGAGLIEGYPYVGPAEDLRLR